MLLAIADGSITTCTKLALTCKGMKKVMVRGARARKGLRLSAHGMQLAVRAQKAGLFDVAEVHLTKWERSVSCLRWFCSALPKITLITIPAHHSRYFCRRATSLLSYRLRRTVKVRGRTCDSSRPWQLDASDAALFLDDWLMGKGITIREETINERSDEDLGSDDEPDAPTTYNSDPLGRGLDERIRLVTRYERRERESMWSGDENVLVSMLVPPVLGTWT